MIKQHEITRLQIINFMSVVVIFWEPNDVLNFLIDRLESIRKISISMVIIM